MASAKNKWHGENEGGGGGVAWRGGEKWRIIGSVKLAWQRQLKGGASLRISGGSMAKTAWHGEKA